MHIPRPSNTTLDAVPGRVLRFSMAIKRFPEIARHMARYGYTRAQDDQAWTLLRELAEGPLSSGAPASLEVAQARIAQNTLDQWDEPWFDIARFALARSHPEQASFVFQGLEAVAGAGAVLAVERFLDRLDALESAPEREATRDADAAALATLASRGVDADERARLRDLVAQARAMPDWSDALAEADAGVAATEAYYDRLYTLYVWYKDWSTVARRTIQRRDHLISLGLAHRVARQGPDDEDELV